MSRIIAALVLLLSAGGVFGQATITQGTNISVHASRDGRLAMDVLGKIWILPPSGGVGKPTASGPAPARRPRWSPAGDAIAFQAKVANQQRLWLYRVAENSAAIISDGQFFDQHPSWHPGGGRIVYSSDRRDSGFDLWEMHLETGLTWRISHQDGDELEPVWAPDGRDLAYIHRHNGQWSLMLRRHGQPDRVLESSASRLSAAEWRPDGSLITFLRHGDAGLSIDMAILSEPPLIREFLVDEDLFDAPVTWLDRQQFLYTANGLIRKRRFNSWSSSNVPFRVPIERSSASASRKIRSRKLPATDAPDGRLIIRVGRLFDGLGGGYRTDVDIVIDGGRIAAIEAQVDRPGMIVVDMGDLTALPGLIDGLGSLPPDTDALLGPLLLSYGVTTIVAANAGADTLSQQWSGKDIPGPRVLGEGWQPDLDTARSMLLGIDAMPPSPAGLRYQDQQIGSLGRPSTILSGLADSRTSDLRPLMRSRQAHFLKQYPTSLRRYTEKPQLAAAAASVVLASKPNGLAPGIAQQAELRALADAGLTAEQALRAAGVNAATALGLGPQLGRIATGSVADIVIVDGDPLSDIRDAQKIVGVVRNGRFFSAIGLIERVQGAVIVE